MTFGEVAQDDEGVCIPQLHCTHTALSPTQTVTQGLQGGCSSLAFFEKPNDRLATGAERVRVKPIGHRSERSVPSHVPEGPNTDQECATKLQKMSFTAILGEKVSSYGHKHPSQLGMQ